MPDVSNWSTMKKLVWLRGNPATGQSEGKIPLTLTAGAAPMLVQASKKSKVTSCAVSFSPWQEGSGDPAPDNVRPVRGWRGCRIWRTGKNLIDKSTIDVGFIVGSSGAVNSNTNYRHTDYIPIVPSAEYTISGGSWFGSNSGAFYNANKTYISELKIYGGYPYRFTAPDGAYYMRLSLEPGDVDTIQCEPGSTPTAYEPFSGETVSVEFPALGKNLLDPAGFKVGYYIAGNGNIAVGATNTVTEYYCYLEPNTAYTVSANREMFNIGVCLYQGTEYTSVISRNNNYHVSSVTIEANQTARYARFWFDVDGQTTATEGTLIGVNPQLEKGSTATAYEPYGTIYGGTVDVVTGDGEITTAITDLGTGTNFNWAKDNNRPGVFYKTIANDRKSGSNILACSMYAVNNISVSTSIDNYISGFSSYSGSSPFIRDSSKAEATGAEFNTYVTGGKAAYILATPTPLTFPTASLIIPKGYNYIRAEMIQ